MTEAEFYSNVAKKLDISFKEAKDGVSVILECITEELLRDGKVKLVDFGSFEVVDRAPRKGHNPHTGEVFDIPACKEPVFKAGKALKELVNE